MLGKKPDRLADLYRWNYYVWFTRWDVHIYEAVIEHIGRQAEEATTVSAEPDVNNYGNN